MWIYSVSSLWFLIDKYVSTSVVSLKLATNRFPNVCAAISKIIPAHEIFLRRLDPAAIIFKAELAFPAYRPGTLFSRARLTEGEIAVPA